MEHLPYHIIEAIKTPVPIIVSVPHCGIAFPPELKDNYQSDRITDPDDTDFHVERLYDFVPEMGITMIYAHYCRWVIDLNRSPGNQPLYQDGRIITGLTPTYDFFGNPIYKNPKLEPDELEITRRKDLYYYPYYHKLSELIQKTKARFGKVLLWDAHSIRRSIPPIRHDPFPDLILGSNDYQSANPDLINIALNNLSSGSWDVKHNDPFIGGHITRHFGQPESNEHALQLEMVKQLYMGDLETAYDSERAERVRKLLRKTFTAIIEALMNDDRISI